MKSLADLSADVIAQILDYADTSYLVIDLWKCGNAILNTKLAQSVATVSLKDRNWTQLLDGQNVSLSFVIFDR